jgi:hypothetical protein
MAFPTDPLDVTVELAIGADIHADPSTWSWTDVTTSVESVARMVTVSRGRRNRVGLFPPTRASAVVDNTDGALSRHNPLSPHFGLLKKNTPMRVRVDNGGGPQTRAAVYVPGFPPSWNVLERDQVVTLNGVGIKDRLGRSRVLNSALYGSMTGMSASGYVPHEYWPMEDGEQAEQFASAVGGAPMVVRAGVVPGTDGTLPGSKPLPSLTEAANVSAGATVRTYTDSGQWVAQFVAKIPDDGGPSINTLLTVTTAPAVSRYVQVGIGPSGLILQIYSDAGADSGGWTAVFDTSRVYGQWVSFVLTAEDDASGTTDRMSVSMYDTNGEQLATISQLVGVGYYGTVARLDLNGVTGVGIGAGEAHYGHLGFYTDPAWTIGTDDVHNARAAGGWVGEMAHERFERLCRQARVPYSTAATTSQAMGPQTVGKLLDLLRQCEVADQGLLYENMDFGLTFVSAAERYNQSAAITLAYGSGHILPPWEPDDDDQDYYNLVTATRPNGSSATVEDEDDVDNVGEYTDPINPNVQSDEQLANVAGLRLNVGLCDELTWPAVRPNVRLGGALLDAWLATDLGDQLHVTGHPSPLAPDTIRQIVEGYTETLGLHTYDVTANLSPASPWDVAEFDDDDNAKIDTDGSELTASVSSSATTLTVATLSMDSPLWTTDSGEMPVPVALAGEVVSATAIQSSIRDTFAGSSSNGWGTSDSGHAWTIGAGTASLFSETSGVGRIAISALNTVHHISVDAGYAARQRVRVYNTLAVTPTGAAINWGLLLRYVDAGNYYWIDVQVGTSGSLTLRVISVISSVVTQLATATSLTTHSTSVARILAAEIGDDDLIRAKVYANGATEPEWELSYQASTSDLQTGTRVGCIGRLMTGNTNVGPVNLDFDNFAVLNPQAMTVTRSVNGVSKSQTAGTAVNVHHPARLAL